jgi:hypothetical protein
MVFCSSTIAWNLFFNWAVHLFILLALSVTLWTWTSNIDGQEEEDQLYGPLILLSLFFTFFLWDHVKDKMCSKKVIMLDELKSQITAAIAYVTKDNLQHNWQEVVCRRNICRATDGAHCEVFHT